MDLSESGVHSSGDHLAAANRRRRTMKHSSALTMQPSPSRGSYSALADSCDLEPRLETEFNDSGSVIEPDSGNSNNSGNGKLVESGVFNNVGATAAGGGDSRSRSRSRSRSKGRGRAPNLNVPARSFDATSMARQQSLRFRLMHQSSCAAHPDQSQSSANANSSAPVNNRQLSISATREWSKPATSATGSGTVGKQESVDSDQLSIGNIFRSEWTTEARSATDEGRSKNEVVLDAHPGWPGPSMRVASLRADGDQMNHSSSVNNNSNVNNDLSRISAVHCRDIGVMTERTSAEFRRSASVSRLNPDDNPLGSIGLQVMKLCGAMPGFRQLQKVSSLSVQSTESLEKPTPRSKLPSTATYRTSDCVPIITNVTAANSATVLSSSPVFKSRRISKQHSASEKSQVEFNVPHAHASAIAISIDTALTPCDDKAEKGACEHFEPLLQTSVNNAVVVREQQPTKTGVGFRLGRRRALYEKRRRMADYSLLVAALGILLTVIETELTMADVYSKQSIYSMCTKMAISISTAALLVLICAYHTIEVQLFSIDNGIEDWRVAIHSRRIVCLAIEVLVCAVHPVPLTGSFVWVVELISANVTSEREVPVDAILALPMFLRLYLIFRVMLLHSKLFTDASSRSIGALNRIKFNIRFVLKTMMTVCPGTVLLVLILSLLIVASWTIRLCERYHEAKYQSILNALWFASITFLSIGYGDVVPSTVCGRLIAITTGVIGSGCTALVIAVVATKLELSRAEQHVHNFMLDTQLTKQLKNAAANVLRETWFIYKYTKLTKRVNASKVRQHQRLFLEAIQKLRRVKMDQQKLTENSMRLTDLPKLHHQLHDIVSDSRQEQFTLCNHVRQLEDKIHSFEKQIDEMPRKVAEILMPQLLRIMQAQSSTPNLYRPTPVANRGGLLRQSTVQNEHLTQAASGCGVSPTGISKGPRSALANQSPLARRNPGVTPAPSAGLATRNPRIEAVTQTTFATSSSTDPSVPQLQGNESDLAQLHHDVFDRRTNDTQTLTVENYTGVQLPSRHSDISMRRLAQTDMCNSSIFGTIAVPVLASSENCSLSAVPGATSANEETFSRVGSKASVSTTQKREKIAECPTQFRSFSHA